MNKKVLVIVAHPYLNRSVANKFITDHIKNVPNVTVHDLYEEYPYFNINVKKGAVAKFKDFLSSDAVTKLSVSCSKQVLQQKKESQGADVNLGDETLKKLYEDIARVSSDLALWTFTTDKAQIQFDQYVVGAYSEGAFSCDIPYTELRPLVKKGFPLP